VTLGEEMDGRAIEALLSRIKVFLHDGWAINHATLEPEIHPCEGADLLGRWGDTSADAHA
jgi:hypothetical protein